MSDGAWRYRLLVVLIALAAIGLLRLHGLQRDEAVGEVRAPPTAPVRNGEWLRHREAHEVVGAADCREDPAEYAAVAPAIHRWVDARGVVHFSDRPPRDGEARVADTGTRWRAALALQVEQVDVVLPQEALDAVRRDVPAIARAFERALGVPPRRELALQLVLVGSDEAFRAEAPATRSDAAVYVAPRQRLVLRTRASHEGTLDALRHELVHVLLHEWVGTVPTALAEGLADYFESFRSDAEGDRVDPSRYAAQLGGDPPPVDGVESLTDLLTLSDAAFHAQAAERHYTWSLGLVSTLMADVERRHVLAALLRAQRMQPCTRIDAAAMLNRAYPGGLRTLAADWRATHRARGADMHAL